MKNNKVITRFPPSPTGLLHVGSVRTMLFNYLFAKQNNGEMRLRIEDTDKERSKPEYEKYIYDSMQWLGIKHDGEVVRQQDRGALYKQKIQELLDTGKAYISKEEIKEEGQRPEVIRFKNPKVKITFNDMIRGEITFDTTDLGDFIIAKSLEEPVYHLAVVVDDIDMGVTHVIRGEDHISNTPRQILIIEALGSARPIYAHLPLILAPDKSKLSKRKHGEQVATLYYKEKGFLPEAMINFMALLGWNPGDDQEIFTMDQLLEKFSIEKIQKAGAIFNIEKFRWLNKEWIKKMPEDEVAKIISEKIGTDNKTIINIVKERIETWGDIDEILASGEYDFFFNDNLDYDVNKLPWKNTTHTKTKETLEKITELLTKIEENNWNKEIIKNQIWSFVEENGKGETLWPLRFALSGKDKSPDPFTLSEVFGKIKTIEKIQIAIKKIEENNHE